ncbi:MAG: hypothetical protein HY390_02455 [Deltaproteobacteria bacterium]|nr:hypothetical protein [Deltaproteobacteria bacterium]
MKKNYRLDVFLLVIFLSLALPAAFYGYRAYRLYYAFALETETKIGSWTVLEYYTVLKNVDAETFKRLRPGLVEKGSQDIKIAELDHIYGWRPSDHDSRNRDVFVRMLLHGRKLAAWYFYFRGQLLKDGAPLSFSFQDFPTPCSGIVLRKSGLYDTFDPAASIRLTWAVFFENIPLPILNKIREGDISLSREGNNIEKIQKILNVTQPLIHKLHIGANLYLSMPEYPRVGSLKALISFKGVNNKDCFYVKNRCIIRDAEIYFETFQYTLKGTVTDLHTTKTIYSEKPIQ